MAKLLIEFLLTIVLRIITSTCLDNKYYVYMSVIISVHFILFVNILFASREKRRQREREREKEEVTSMSEYFICGELHLRF